MNKLHIYILLISILTCATTFAQDKTELSTEETDTIAAVKKYNLRVGIDISKPILSQIKDDLSELEITADVNISKNLYAAVELGYSDKTRDEDYLNFTTDGTYIKLGVNYNAYENWKGMNNEIYVGMRYGFSMFNQTLNSYTPNAYGTYFEGDLVEVGTEFKDLSAHWVEFLFGMKVETFRNLYLGGSISVNKLISSKEPENFRNLYIPGFNRVFDNDMGIGFNYTISYLIPIFKKTK
ncbi:hypothetical protein SAMN05444411_102192 [Lutibacter oricola]|uniref:Outer membrane protein beta-barrel domain-containing protein n=1 Tax=Lutibacter oricola TaxID=762486 RepID=A0A1H2WGA3_9FLAO|nr:DUF6048 family protein [Lutibacter oricola]SDW79585.1 hypothetical protein SAMN05444411_102192 [Lutibacter oricola]